MASREHLNQTLRANAPAAWACLSPMGRDAVSPQGIPAQSAEARGCTYTATMGQVTDGHDHAVPLPALARALGGIDPEQAFLYSPQGGLSELRQAWRSRLLRAGSGGAHSLPLVTIGLTHGISLVADLFCEPGTPVLCPFPTWGNYSAAFGLRRGAALQSWPFFTDDGGLDIPAFEAALATLKVPAVVILNFPGNPTGCSPTLAQWDRIRAALLAHPTPLVVVCDDAYNGMVWESGLLVASPFNDLVRDADPARLLPIKVDGVTKELGFFGGRVGFLTFGIDGAAADALEDKAKALIRATVSCLPGPSQAAVLAALGDPALPAQEQHLKDLLRTRYDALRSALGQLDGTTLRPRPFNAGFFALIQVEGQDADTLRRMLIAEHSVGLIAITSVNALRIAYGAISAEDIPELVARLRRAVTPTG